MKQGMKISIGGEEFILPPLGFAGLKATVILRSKYDELPDDEKMDATVEIIHASLLRNYPDLPLEWITERLDAWEYTEFVKALPVLFSKSGLEVSKVGETE